METTKSEAFALNIISTFYGMDDHQAELLMNTFSTVKASGSVSRTDLSVFTSLGIPLLATLARLRNVHILEILESSKNGGVSFDEINTAVLKMVSDGNGILGFKILEVDI